MPSFQQDEARARRWADLPGLEWTDAGDRACLTFDDGPDPAGTPAVLEALASLGARATFFLVGEQVERAPELAERIAAEGHEVGLHGHGHIRHDELEPGAAAADMARGLEAVERAAAVRPTRYRPPYGAFTAESYSACLDLGLEPVYWSAWGLDWEPIPAERIADLVVRDLAPGAIVLLHDSARYAPRPDPSPTAAALEPIARAAADEGLALTSLAAAE